MKLLVEFFKQFKNIISLYYYTFFYVNPNNKNKNPASSRSRLKCTVGNDMKCRDKDITES